MTPVLSSSLLTPPPPPMTVREVADFLRLTETTVYHLLQKGTLPGKKIGGQWRISQTALAHWLDNAHAEGPTPPPSDPHASAGAG